MAQKKRNLAGKIARQVRSEERKQILFRFANNCLPSEFGVTTLCHNPKEVNMRIRPEFRAILQSFSSRIGW